MNYDEAGNATREFQDSDAFYDEPRAGIVENDFEALGVDTETSVLVGEDFFRNGGVAVLRPGRQPLLVPGVGTTGTMDKSGERAAAEDAARERAA